MHALVLERERGLLECGLVRVVAMEVELRLLDRVRAEHLLQRLDVRVLVVGHRLQEHPRLEVLDEALLVLGDGGLVVERRLEVLERQRVVEDPDVTLAELGGRTVPGRKRHRRRRQCSEDGAAADDCATGEAGATQERRPGVAVECVHRLGGGLPHGTVHVDVFQVEFVRHD